jgi:hypothetical protein
MYKYIVIDKEGNITRAMKVHDIPNEVYEGTYIDVSGMEDNEFVSIVKKSHEHKVDMDKDKHKTDERGLPVVKRRKN